MELSPAAAAGFDLRRRFVRVTGTRPNGFVEFEFAIGEPELFVEMILGKDAFEEFCTANAVTMLDPDQSTVVGGADGDWNWRLADATRTRFR